MKRIYVIGTADTKGEELLFLRNRIAAAGQDTVLVDVGTRQPQIAVDISAEEVAARGTSGFQVPAEADRGTAVAAMAQALSAFLPSRTDIGGIVGIGGGGGTSIATAGMRALPIGLPKIMVSTLASGDVGAFVGVSDIIMMPAVTDIAGLNRLSRTILHNAAQAIAGMVANPAPIEADQRPVVGLTMFGVTTPAVTQIAAKLGADYETMVFHATGTGGRTMESLVASGLISGVLDITTTEICDLLFGGVLAAGEDRLDVIAERGIPYVGSVGALDMVNFWAPSTIPDRYAGRNFYRHNDNVTLMRTSSDENRALGEWIGRKLNRCSGPVRFLIPEKGVSALDVAGGPFWNPKANAALFEAIETTVQWTTDRQLHRIDCHINDHAFADRAEALFRSIMISPPKAAC